MSPANQLWKWQRMQELGALIVPGAFSAAAKFQNLPGFQMVQGVQKTARVEPHVASWPQVRDMLDSVPLQTILVEKDADPAKELTNFARKAEARFWNQPVTAGVK
jgi:enhancing lycopene biosynthesis protein 2